MQLCSSFSSFCSFVDADIDAGDMMRFTLWPTLHALTLNVLTGNYP
jgi:hypothetical protein